MIRIVLLLLGCLTLLAMPMAGMAADTNAGAAGKKETLDQAYARMQADPTYQKEFLQPPAPPELRPGPQWLRQLLAALGTVFRYLFWIGVAVVVGGFVFYMGRELIRLRRPAKTDAETDDTPVILLQPEAGKARVLLDDADRLAGEGRFAEAVHLLLFRSIADLEEHLPGHVKRSQTSREIEILTAMPPEPKSGFEQIRQMVETSFFGGRGVDADAYAKARKAYEAFAFSAQWSAA